MNDAVKEFWQQQAEQYGGSDLATAPDHYYREMEITRIENYLTTYYKSAKSILDVGCGNGYSTLHFANCLPDAKIMAIDYSEAMIAAAGNQNDCSISFAVADVRKALPDQKFDVIISERCLINLASWQEQHDAILRMAEHLTARGVIILVENTIQGLHRLNLLRGSLGLHPISQRWHNCYIDEAKLEKLIKAKFKLMHKENIGNLYYIISRVVYAKICDIQGVEPDYNDVHNEIAAALPSLGDYAYSPNWLWVLKPRL